MRNSSTWRRPAALAAAAAAVVLVVATACDSNGGGSDSDDPIQLYNDKGAWGPFFEELGELSAEQIGLAMEPVGYTDAETYDAFIRASFRTNVKPDLFTWHTGGRLVEIVEAGQLADTSQLWTDAIADGYLTEELREHYTVDGSQYCVPANVSYWVMFYNKEVFDDAGVDSPPTTWDEMMAAAEAVAATGVAPFYSTAGLFNFAWFQQLLVGSDPDLYEALTTGDASFTDPGVVEVMELWKSLFDDGYMSDPGDETDPAAVLASGRAAMAPFGTWFNTSMTQQDLTAGEDYGMFVIPNANPALPRTHVLFESGPLCVLAEAPRLEQSLQFAEWWLTPDAQELWANSRGDVSANPQVSIPDPELAAINDSAGSGELALANRYFEAFPPSIVFAGLDAFGAFVVNPDTYLTQLENLQHAADDHWGRAGG